MPAVKLEHNWPDCGGRISLDVAVGVIQPNPLDLEKKWLSTISQPNREIVELAERSGILDAFRQARDASGVGKSKPPKPGYKFLSIMMAARLPVSRPETA